MAKGGRIDYTIGFNIDKTGLTDIQTSLQQFSKLKAGDFLSSGLAKDAEEAKKILTNVQNTASKVGQALEHSFDSTTGVMNLEKLNFALKSIGMNNISKDFAAAGEIGNQAFYKITKGALTTNMQLRQTNTLLDRMGETLSNTIKWGISSSLMNKFVGSVQQAYGYVQHLDTSLNDIRIVTGKSADEMDRFAESANKVAKTLGSSTTEYTEAALIYYQQGLSDEEAQARAETTLKAANVTGQTGRQVSEELTAVWNGYKVTAEETEQYVDKLAAVAATTASDLEELSTGMSKVASAANNMGVDVDQLNAQLATIISVTRQAPETAGTALKTIYARMEDLKIGGEDESGVKLGDVSSTLDEVGISVMDAEGNLRDLGEVIEEVAAHWEDWTNAQQSAIAQALAGKRQYNNLLALFDNWDMYESSLETSRNAVGTLQKQQDIYMESTAAHLQQLKTQWEDFYDSLIDSSDVNSILDGATNIVNVFTRFLDGIGGGKNALLMLGSTAMNVFDKQIAAGITHAIQSFSTMRNNAKELEAQMNNIALFKQSSQYQDYAPVKTLVDSLDQVSKYYGVLNNEQINQANTLAQQVADAKELEIQWQKNAEALKVYQQNIGNGSAYKDLATKGFDLNNFEDMQDRSRALKQTLTDIKALSSGDEFQEIQDLFDSFKDDSGFQQFLDDNKIGSNTEAVNNFNESISNTENLINELNKQGLFQNVSTDKINEIQQSLNGLKNATGPDEARQHLENLKRALEQCGPEAENMVKELLKINEAGSKVNFDAPAQSLQRFLQQAEMQNFITNLTSGVSAVGQFASGINSLSHSFDILGDSSLSTSEKITQFLSSTAMGFTMLVSSLTNLPNLFNGLSKVPGLVQQLNYHMTAWAEGIDKTVIAEKYLANMNDEQITALYKRIGIQKAATAELTADEYAKIADTMATEGNVIVTEELTAANVRLNTVLSKLWKTLLANPWVLVAASLTVVLTTITAINKAHRNAAKSAAEAAEAEYQAAKETADATKEQYENVKKLVDAYKELKEEYSADQVNDLKQRIYELSQEYDVNIDMVELMGASYEELDGIMNRLLQDISSQNVADSLSAVNAQIASIVAEMNSIQLENNHPILDFMMQLSNWTEKVRDNVYDFVEKLTGFEIPTEWHTIFGVGGSWGAGPLAYNKSTLAQAPQTVQDVISLNDSGQLELYEELFAEYTEEQQKIVEDWVKSNYTDSDSIMAGYVGMLDHSAENIAKAIENTSEKREEARTLFSDLEKSKASDVYTQAYGSEGITSIADYKAAKSTISTAMYEDQDLNLTRKQADDLAIETLKNSSSYKISGGTDIVSSLEDAGNFTEKELDQVITKLDSLSDSQINFVASNIDLINSLKMSGQDVETIFDQLGNSLDTISNEDYTIEINTLIGGSKNGKEYKESLQDLFANETVGLTQEQFSSLDEGEQDFVLLTKRRELLEQNKEVIEEENQRIQENNAALDEEIQKQTELAEAEKKTNAELQQQFIDDLTKEDNFDQSLLTDVLGFEEGSQELEDFKQRYSNTMADLIDVYQQATEEGENGFEAVAEAMKKIEDSDINEYLEKYIYKQRFASEEVLSTEEATNQLISSLYGSKKALIESDKKLEDYNKDLGTLTNSYEDVIEDTHNYAEDVSNTKTAISNLNKSIDTLQSSYQSLQSIVSDYNEDGALTLDNLQALIEMDDEYAAALEIQNGVMSINEESMKSAADAKLQMAKIEVTEAYLAELDAIAHNQATNANKDFIESELNATSATTGFTNAVKEGYDALLKYAQAKSEAFSVDSAAAETATKAYYNKMQMIESLSTQSASSILGKSDTSSSSSSSSSSDEPDEEEYLEREEDLYRAINEELDDIEATLGRIEKTQDHSWGLSYKNTLEDQNELLKDQLELLEKKKDTYEDDLSTRRKQLEDQGVIFSEDGSVMTNAETRLNELYDEYNSMVDTYNSMTASQQEAYSSTLEAQKDTIDNIEDAIDDYESAYSEYNSVLDELLDTHYELIENEVNQFNADVEIHLELAEAEDTWNDFWYDVVQDVDDTDFGGKIAKSFSKLSTLTGENGTINELTHHLNDVIAEVDKQIAGADIGGGDSIFGDDTALSKETLIDYRDKLIDAVTTAKQNIDDMVDTYLDALDDAKDKIDEQIEGWETVGDHIEHNIELIKLVSGNEAYDAIGKQYNQMYENNLALVRDTKSGMDFWQERMNYYQQQMTSAQTEAERENFEQFYKKAKENYTDAVKTLDSSLTNAIEKRKDAFLNVASEIADKMDKAFSKGMGISGVKNEWDLALEKQEHYLDNVERSLAMEELDGIFKDILDDMDARSDKQQEFLKFQDEEIAKLNEREKLTQYDIDELKARLEIKKQELALEEAQQNKSNLRLRRDSQGNYSYQYTADEDAIDDAQDGLLNARQEWYELVKKRNQETAEAVIEIRTRALEVMEERSQALADKDLARAEELTATLKALQDEEKYYMQDAEKAKRDFFWGTAEFFEDVEQNTILPMWNTTIEQMIDEFVENGEDSFIGAVKTGISEVDREQEKFVEDTNELLNTAGVNYKELVSTGIDPTTESLESLNQTEEEFNDTLDETIDLFDDLESSISEATAAYNELKDAAVGAIEEANRALNTLAATAVSAISQINSAISSAESATSLAASKAGTSSGSSSNSGSSLGGSTTTGKTYTLVTDPYGVSGTYGIQDETGNYVYINGDKEVVRKKLEELQKQNTIVNQNQAFKGTNSSYKTKKIVLSGKAFDTGGYTGEWTNGSKDGKLAVLHQKELVLNEADTTNILTAVQSVRDLVKGNTAGNFSGIAESIASMAQAQVQTLAQVGSGMLQAIASMVNNSNSEVQNYRNMTVNADFSGVRSADAIYQALMELDNYGVQQAYSDAPSANKSY